MVPRVALIDPLGDAGIGTYTHELAEALRSANVEADVFVPGASWIARLSGRHWVFPVLGSPLFRQRHILNRSTIGGHHSGPKTEAGRPQGDTRRPTRIARFVRGRVRDSYLSIELALWLRRQNYDLLWTQWPSVSDGSLSLWSAARAAGLRVVHTAHNVFPHEVAERDHRRCAHVYRRAQRIVVHSRMAADALGQAFRFAEHKLVISRHGLYTTYPRNPARRDEVRARLGVRKGTTLALIYGAIRPYKNVQTAIDALRSPEALQIELLIAGRETGYGLTDVDPSDMLHRTREYVSESGLTDRVHLVPGRFTNAQTADFFEAADLVLLPYLESWGSGLLCLALSYGKPVVVSRTGGMDEYVEGMPSAIVLDDVTPRTVRTALQQMRHRLRNGLKEGSRPVELEWPNIVGKLLPQLLP